MYDSLKDYPDHCASMCREFGHKTHLLFVNPATRDFPTYERYQILRQDCRQGSYRPADSYTHPAPNAHLASGGHWRRYGHYLRRLGHQSSKITREIYFHVTQKIRESDRNKITTSDCLTTTTPPLKMWKSVHLPCSRSIRHYEGRKTTKMKGFRIKNETEQWLSCRCYYRPAVCIGKSYQTIIQILLALSRAIPFLIILFDKNLQTTSFSELFWMII